MAFECGAGCRILPIFASEMDARLEPRIAVESRALQSHLTTDRPTYQHFLLKFHETCCFLDAVSRCTIYPTRLDVCPDIPTGGDQCQAARTRLVLPPLVPTVEG
jgi:hypothetical protein